MLLLTQYNISRIIRPLPIISNRVYRIDSRVRKGQANRLCLVLLLLMITIRVHRRPGNGWRNRLNLWSAIASKSFQTSRFSTRSSLLWSIRKFCFSPRRWQSWLTNSIARRLIKVSWNLIVDRYKMLRYRSRKWRLKVVLTLFLLLQKEQLPESPLGIHFWLLRTLSSSEKRSRQASR